MRIGYDAKRIFHNRTGLGNYGRDVVRILTQFSPIKDFFLFNTKRSNLEKIVALDRAKIIYPDGFLWQLFPSLWTLFVHNKQIEKLELDAFHGLSGEIPIGFKKSTIPKIVTIHDLIFLSHPHFYSILEFVSINDSVPYVIKVRMT